MDSIKWLVLHKFHSIKNVFELPNFQVFFIHMSNVSSGIIHQ